MSSTLIGGAPSLQPGVRFFKALCNLSKPIGKYGLRIPDTYYAEEGKLLVFDETKGCVARIESVLDERFRSRLEMEARAHADQDEPAYIFCKRSLVDSTFYPTQTVRSRGKEVG